MRDEPEFLGVDDVLLLHELQVTRYGGGSGIRDRAALESAVAVPQATFGGKLVHGDLFAMAAAYAFHIAQDHPFVDGNTRTGLVAALGFLDLNGIAVPDPAGRLHQAMIDLVERRARSTQTDGLLAVRPRARGDAPGDRAPGLAAP